jgi:pimeloyl-ACP methyl ester carboxylesterase
MSNSKPVASMVVTMEPAGQINWHVEQRGSGQDIVLVPSGEGDCGSFEIVANALAADFRVTTFDTPGFSRSTTSGHVEISMVALADQVVRLVQALGIQRATFYGCSSAGLAVLDIAANYRSLIHRAVVHEAALPRMPGDDDRSALAALAQLDDARITAVCAKLFKHEMNENPDAWEALGEAYHHRLATNYVVWVRKYGSGPKHAAFDPTTIEGKPIEWTIGGLTEVRRFFNNVRLSRSAGLDLNLLPCKHFPQVSIPALLAEHIKSAALGSVPA